MARGVAKALLRLYFSDDVKHGGTATLFFMLSLGPVNRFMILWKTRGNLEMRGIGDSVSPFICSR